MTDFIDSRPLEYGLIERLIHSFYEVATRDVFIGYLFIPIQDFMTHIPRIANFWFFQVHGRFHHPEPHPFDLINVHRPLNFKKAHVHRWVLLFFQSMEKLETSDKALQEHPGWQKIKERVKFFEQIFLKNAQLFPLFFLVGRMFVFIEGLLHHFL